jgi:hypothetical protein
MTTAVVAKLRPPNPDVEATKRIAELERQVEELELRLEIARSEANDWRARYEQMALPYAQAQNAALQQYAQAQLQAAMNAQNFYPFQQAQPGLQAFDGFCNCVPSRSQVWAVTDPDEAS